MTTDARCWNCKHWEGERVPLDMSWGDCPELPAVLYIEPIRVPREFSCILHEPEETDDANA